MCHRSARSGRRFDMVVVKRWSFRRTVDSHPSHVQTLRNHCNTLWVLAWVFFLECPFPPPLRPPTPAPVRYGKWGAGGGDEYVRPPLADSRGWKRRTDGQMHCMLAHPHTHTNSRQIYSKHRSFCTNHHCDLRKQARTSKHAQEQYVNHSIHRNYILAGEQLRCL